MKNAMEIEVIRYNSPPEYTDGLMFIDEKFECFTIEDAYHEVKVYGKTRIPDGIYKVEFRTVGDFHQKYTTRYAFHKGMLWIKDVPGFEYILIHTGNTSKHTKGCLIVGSSADRKADFVGGSRSAYIDLYPKIADALVEGKEVTIEFQTIG